MAVRAHTRYDRPGGRANGRALVASVETGVRGGAPRARSEGETSENPSNREIVSRLLLLKKKKTKK